MTRIAALIFILSFLTLKVYAQPPAPGITGTTTICTGNGAAYTATGQAGATFRWWDAPVGGNLKSSVAAYTIPVQTTAGVYHWYVEQTVGGITGPRTDLAVTVNQTPSVSISPGSPTVCAGSSTTLTASGADTYSWNTGATGAGVSVSPTVNTNYTVTGTLSGCSASASTTVSVNKTVASGDVTICPGSNTTLSASGASTYVWNPGGLTGSSVSVSPMVTTMYIVSGTGSGCTTTDTVMVNVYPIIGLTAGADATIAEGTVFNLTCSSALSATYTWTPNQGNSGTLSGNSVFVVPTQTTTYTVTSKDVNNCNATATTTVTLSKLAGVSGNTILCPGGTTTLTAAGAGPFTWYDAASGGNLVFTGAVFNTPALSTSKSYWVSANGGSRKEVKLNVIGNTISTVTATPSVLCNGDTARLQTNYPGLVKWYDAPSGGTQVGSSTLAAPFSATPSLTTTYYAEAVPTQVNMTFSYTGNVQTWTVPDGVTSISVDAYGSSGEQLPSSKPYRGKGGRVQATIDVVPGQVLHIYVGGRNNWNGGGGRAVSSGPWMGTRGGDATDIRVGGTALTDRVLVAGGGGGTGVNTVGSIASSDQGHGGGLTGQNGGHENLGDGFAQVGKGASQTAAGAGGVLNGVVTSTNYGLPGAFGQGGRSGAYSSQYSGGGGGGGWYGGGGGTASGDGGGGSSYTNPIVCHNVIHTQGAWEDEGVVFITYGAPCSGSGARVPLTIPVKQVFTAAVSDTLANGCAGSAVSLYALGLAPSKEVAGFDGTQPTGANGNAGHSSITSVTNSFTMEFWVKPGSTITPLTASTVGGGGITGQRYAIMPRQSGNNAGAGVSVGTNGISVFEHGNGYLPSLLTYTGTIPDTTFTHVAVVYTAKQPVLYINGSLAGTGLTSTMPNIYPSIGSDGAGSYGPFIGQLDNVRIWNAPLSQAEILSVMGKVDTAIPGKTLVARYTFNNGSVADDKGMPAQAPWTSISNNPQQNHYLYTWSGTGAVPTASALEKQTTTAALGTSRYWLKVAQNGCVATSDTLSATTDAAPGAIVSGTTTVCQDGAQPLITFTGSGSTAPYTFTYNINGGSSQTVSTPIKRTRYIRIKQNGTAAGDYLHLAEIRAIEQETGANVALGKNGTANSTNATYPITNLTDNSITNYWHSSGTGPAEYVELDLGAAYRLDRVELVNRQDCCWDREKNLQYILKDSSGAEILSQQINAWQNQNTNYKTTWPGTATAVTVAVPTTAAGVAQYNLVSVKSAYGCTNVQSGSAQVTVAAPPRVTVAASTGSSICAGTPVTFNATVVNGAGQSYQWYRNGIVVGTTGSYANSSLANGDSISVKVTNTGACASVPATAYVKMQVNPYPMASLSGSNCTDAPLLLTSNLLPAQLQWKSGNTVMQISSIGWNADAGTVAGGSGGNGLNQLNGPVRLFMDAAGNLYIPDASNHRVVKWAPGASAGVIVAGGNGQGSGANQLNTPMGVYADAMQNVYVADFSNMRVQRWAPGASSGVTVAGITGNGGATPDRLREPINVTMDASGNLYITDCFNHRIQKWAPGADTGITVAGNSNGVAGTGNASLSYPYSAKVDAAGNIYVADNANNRVVKWAPGAASGTVVAGTGSSGNAAGQLNTPSDIAVDGIGNLYITDQNNHRVQRWAPGASSGVTVAGTGNAGNAAAQLQFPTGIVLDAAGNLFVTDNQNNRVQKFSPAADTSYVPSAAGSYTAVVTSLAGCATTTAPRTIGQMPSITADPVAALPVCTGNPVVLNVVAGNAASYVWLKDGSGLPGALAADYTKTGAILADAGTYQAVAIGTNGCNDTSASSQVTVTTLSTTLATGNANASTTHPDGLEYNYTDASCNPIADVTDAAGGNALGVVNTVVRVDGSVQSYKGTPYLQRHYDIQPASNGSAVVKLYATQAEFDAYNTYITSNALFQPLMPAGPADAAGISNLMIIQFHGAASAGTNGPGGQYDSAQRELIPNSAISTTWNGHYWTLSFPVSGFSGFFISTGNMVPLAVTLKDISARNIGAHNRVDWTTATEQEGDYMEVERSTDARRFTRIATVPGKSRSGAAYSLVDEQPAAGVNYYRLKLPGASGAGIYSKTVSAYVKEGGFAVSVFPNPARESITIRTSGIMNGTANLSLMDASGKILRQAAMNVSETTLSLEGLAAGYYLLHYQDAMHTQVIKVTRQ